MEEPGLVVRWVIFLFAGGDAGIYAGLGVVIISLLSLFHYRRRKTMPALLVVGFIISLMVFACSSVPLPRWFHVFTGSWILLVFWAWRTRFRGQSGASVAPHSSSQRIWTVGVLTTISWLAIAVWLELPFHVWIPPTGTVTELLVIGDSVTAGLNDGEETWPLLLSRDYAVHVVDASQPGATLVSARQQNRMFADLSGAVLMEIGGNDMLEHRPESQFEADLDHLLSDVCKPGRAVILFELPLPPFHAAYGIAQRRQAKRHGARLIPKRNFARVLTATGATVDGIHLSKDGQSRMKSLVQGLLGKRFIAGTGSFERREQKVVGTFHVP